MNNWRLLLLAVVAVLQPIPSFTERNLIDGHPGCCDHRSNPIITQDTRLYGNYRKSNEESRISIREDVRKEERYGARNDPITRSRERFVVERAESRTTLEPIVKFRDTRFERDQERRYRITVDAREPRKTREDFNRRIRVGQYDRDDSESRRIRTTRGNSRILRHVDERHQDRLASQYARNSENRRISANRQTMAVLSRKWDDVTRDVRRDSRINTFKSETRLLNDNNGRRTLERHDKDIDEILSRSLDARVNRVLQRNYLRTQIESRENRQSFRVTSDRMHERNERINLVRRYSAVERMSADRRQESRDNFNRVDISRRETREQRDKSRRFREDSSVLRESRINTDAERRASLEYRILNNNVPSERIVGNNDHIDHRREAARDRVNARVAPEIDSTVRSERLMRSNERLKRREPSTRSLERNYVLRFSRDSKSSEREQNTRDSLSLPERNVRDLRAARYRREVGQVQKLDERRQQRDVRRLSRDRTIFRFRDSRDNADRTRETQNPIETERRHASELSRSPQSADRTTNERRTRILTRDDTASQRRNYDSRITSRTETSAGIQSTRTFKENRDARRVAHRRDESRATPSRFSMNTISRERTEDQRREVLENRDTQARNEITRNREEVRLGERFEIRRQRDERLSRDRVSSRRQTRDILATPNIERISREDAPRDYMKIRSERLSRSREDRAIIDRALRDKRDFRSSDHSESRRVMEGEIQLNRNRIAMERIDRNSLPANRDIRYETKKSTDNVLAKDNRRNTIDTRFRNLASKVREEVVEDTHESHKATNWQMIFYTLQGAYLCGLLMQMLNEKSKTGKSRNFTWWDRSSKNLVKVD